MRTIFRIIGGILGLIVLATVIIWAVNFGNSDSYDRMVQSTAYKKADLIEKWRFILSNIKDEFSPARRRPTTLLQQQDELKMMVPQVFRAYKYQDWNEFWSYIYDPVYEGDGWIKARRYHSKEEIEDNLKKKYEQPFVSFGKQQWEAFWQILGKDRQVKAISYQDQVKELDRNKMLDKMK